MKTKIEELISYINELKANEKAYIISRVSHRLRNQLLEEGYTPGKSMVMKGLFLGPHPHASDPILTEEGGVVIANEGIYIGPAPNASTSSDDGLRCKSCGRPL